MTDQFVLSEIRIKLVAPVPNGRLLAFAQVTINDVLAIHDFKIIDGRDGIFLAFPSRKTTDKCPDCGCKNHLLAKYCNKCGDRLYDETQTEGEADHRKLYMDVAHPVQTPFRQWITKEILDEYDREVERSKTPGYRCKFLDDYESEEQT